jgi:MoxR-like ATPase
MASPSTTASTPRTTTSKARKKNGKAGSGSSDWEFVEKVLASRHANTVYLWGPPSVGKTFVSVRSGLGDREVFVITLTPDTSAAELRGFFMPKGNEFVWVDGVFIKAMRSGARIVINEIAYASSDVLAILHPVLESRATAQLTLPNLETVYPAEGFQVVCTDNAPMEQLPAALQDRFKSCLHVTEPHPDALARLPEDLREAARRTFDLEADRAVSLRGWLAVHEFEAEFGREFALRAVFGRQRGAQIFRATVLGGA